MEAWLKPLFRPYIVCAYEQVRQHHTVTRPFHTRAGSSMDSTDLPMSVEDARGSPTAGHLALFNQHLSRNNREVEWIYFDGSSEPDMQVLSSKFTDLDIGSERGSKVGSVRSQ